MAIKKNNLNLSIIIPILNEAKNIKKLIPKIYNNLKTIKHKKIQIILVDDNSNDNIDEVFSKLKKNLNLYIYSKEKLIEIYQNHVSWVLTNLLQKIY